MILYVGHITPIVSNNESLVNNPDALEAHAQGPGIFGIPNALEKHAQDPGIRGIPLKYTDETETHNLIDDAINNIDITPQQTQTRGNK